MLSPLLILQMLMTPELEWYYSLLSPKQEKSNNSLHRMDRRMSNQFLLQRDR